jgi:hypothetical protein
MVSTRCILEATGRVSRTTALALLPGPTTHNNKLTLRFPAGRCLPAWGGVYLFLGLVRGRRPAWGGVYPLLRLVRLKVRRAAAVRWASHGVHVQLLTCGRSQVRPDRATAPHLCCVRRALAPAQGVGAICSLDGRASQIRSGWAAERRLRAGGMPFSDSVHLTGGCMLVSECLSLPHSRTTQPWNTTITDLANPETSPDFGMGVCLPGAGGGGLVRRDIARASQSSLPGKACGEEVQFAKLWARFGAD